MSKCDCGRDCDIGEGCCVIQERPCLGCQSLQSQVTSLEKKLEMAKEELKKIRKSPIHQIGAGRFCGDCMDKAGIANGTLKLLKQGT